MQLTTNFPTSKSDTFSSTSFNEAIGTILIEQNKQTRFLFILLQVYIGSQSEEREGWARLDSTHLEDGENHVDKDNEQQRRQEDGVAERARDVRNSLEGERGAGAGAGGR